MGEADNAPLRGLKVAVHANGVAAAYAARQLGTMGADVLLVEAPAGCALRRLPPLVGDGGDGAAFAYLMAGARSVVCDLSTSAGQSGLRALLSESDIFIDDTPVDQREGLGISEAQLGADLPDLIHLSVLPFGSHGVKSGWKGEDLTIQHASGEGNLLPNGLAVEMFPDRAPLKIYGSFGAMQGGVAAALGTLAALWARPDLGGQYIDISSQDAALAVGAFAIQRLGDGDVEHRVKRSFRYGGVIPCADGYVELLTLEQRQWDGLVELLGRPDWALDPALEDSLERSRRGPEINRHIRAWALERNVDDIVSAGQKLNVPLARYKSPADILRDPHERHRGLFQPVDVEGAGLLDMLVSPAHFDDVPLSLRAGPPSLGEHGKLEEAA